MPVAIITGASSGIGHALARELHERGYSVGLVARRADRLRAAKDDLGERVAFATADVSDKDAVSSAVAQIEQTLGPCDLCVANAGISGKVGGGAIDVDNLRAVMDINFFGAANTAAAVLPGMLQRGRGHLAVVSSVAGFRGLPGFGPYSASKAAVSTLFESLRVELGPRGIAVTLVHPGFVVSEMTAPNKFPMPFLVPTDRAARTIANALERRARECVFPWPMALLMGFVRHLPNWMFDLGTRRSVRAA
jgi:short-subunit dehydrogenase